MTKRGLCTSRLVVCGLLTSMPQNKKVFLARSPRDSRVLVRELLNSQYSQISRAHGDPRPGDTAAERYIRTSGRTRTHTMPDPERRTTNTKAVMPAKKQEINTVLYDPCLWGGCISISDTIVHFYKTLLRDPTRNHNHSQLVCITPTDGRAKGVS